MHTSKLLLVIVMAVAMWAYINEMRRTHDQAGSAATAEPHQATERQILEEQTFDSYEECNEAAKAAVQDLTDNGVSAALASQSPWAESTVYMVYYRDSRGQISCRGGRLVNEILASQ